MPATDDLLNLHCQRSTERLAATDLKHYLAALHTDWILDDNDNRISRTFHFKNYYQTIAFVNALAWVTHEQDHHPDLEVGYNRCRVHYTTHSVDGLSENDFICAARIDRLVTGR